MPDEREQQALDQIKAYLDAGHSLDAVRQAGWASWIDDLEAKGYDLQTGKLALRPPQETLADTAQPAAKVSETPAADTPTCAKCGAERVGTRPYCVKCPTKWPDGTPPGRPVETGTWLQSKWLWAAVGVGVLLVGLVILGNVAGGGSTSDGDGQFVLLDSNGETGDPDPPGELAETPRPTATPQPTRPLLPEFTFGECEYLRTMPIVLDDVGSAHLAMADLFGEAGNDPLVLFDDIWRIDVATQFALLQIARDDIQAITRQNR